MEQDLIASMQLDVEQGKLGLKNTEEASGRFQGSRRSIYRNIKGVRVAGPCEAKLGRAKVVKAVNHRDKWILGQALIDQISVEALQHFLWAQKAILGAEYLLALDTALQEH